VRFVFIAGTFSTELPLNNYKCTAKTEGKHSKRNRQYFKVEARSSGEKFQIATAA